MSSAGSVVSCEVQCHADTGRSKGWALVKFATPNEAQFAISRFDQQEFNDRQLSVRMDRAVFEDAGGSVVFVGNLPWSTTDSELRSVFEAYNPIDVHVKTTTSGKSRGFALLRFLAADKASAAVEGAHGTELGGRVLEVRLDRPPEERTGAANNDSKQTGGGGGGRGGRDGPKAEPEPTDTLFVNNLNWNSTDDDLFQHFCSAGATPTSAKVQMSDSNGRSKGWGLVMYASVADADRALTQLNKTFLDERKISVRFDAKA